MIGKAPLLILLGALLNATLIFPLVANLTAIGRTGVPGAFPPWVLPLLAGILSATLYTLERTLLRDHPRDHYQRRFTLFIVGSTLALLFSTVALALHFIGLPLRDLYLASAFSFVLLLSWFWRYRTLVAASVPSQVSRAYSVVLLLVAGWHLLALTMRFVTRGIVAETPARTAVSWYSEILFAILTISCLLVVHLRRGHSIYSGPATTALSVWLAIDFPFGTAAFLYWLLRVRTYEHIEPAA